MPWNPLERRFPDPPDEPHEEEYTCHKCGRVTRVMYDGDGEYDQEDDGIEGDAYLVHLPEIRHRNEPYGSPVYCPWCLRDTDDYVHQWR